MRNPILSQIAKIRRSDWPPGHCAERNRCPADPHSERGFTTAEVIVVVVFVGILMAIAAPSFLNLLTRQRVESAQDQALRAFRQAQSRAKATRSQWQATFRSTDINGETVYQYAVHPSNIDLATDGNSLPWQSFTQTVEVDTAETTLDDVEIASQTYWQAPYDEKGRIDPPLGRITFKPKGRDFPKRCTIRSSILGAHRLAEDGDC